MDRRPSIKEALQGIKGANWRKALEWLQRAPDAVVICNACANSCSKAHHWQMALTLTSQVTWKRLEATEVTCNTAIQAVVRGGRWHQALELASLAFPQVRRDAVTWNSAADAVSRSSDGVQWALSLELLSLESLGLEPDVITESLRAAALKGANGRGHSAVWRKALEFAGTNSLLVTTSALGAFSSAQWRHVLRMLTDVTDVDAQALSVASKLCQESWHWALHLLEEVDRPDAVAISSAMSALSLALNWERALTLFHRLPPRKRDVVCYGAAMTAAAAGKHWELALFWLYEMAGHAVAPNLITYNAAINACEEGLQWDRALTLLQVMASSKVTADVISYSSCIAACGRQRWADAMAFLNEMREEQLQWNIIALSSAVSVCEKAGRWELALDLLQQAWQLKLEVNTVTYNAAISACEKCSQWEMALQLFDDMELLRISRSMITSAAIITACASAASWLHATELLELQSKDPTQQVGARFAALAATCVACEAAGAVATMPKVLKEISESNEVLAVELLHNHGLLCSAAAARLKRKMWHPMLLRCSTLTKSGSTGTWRLYDPILEQESFLSTVFTMDMLHQLQLDIPHHRSWLPTARHRSLLRRSDPTPEPNAKGIAAWTAVRMQRGDAEVMCLGRVHEWSWQWGSADLLVPVFVEHDRSPHAERQALLTWIHQVQSSKVQ